MEVNRDGGRIWRTGSDRAQYWRERDHRIWSFHWPPVDEERPDIPRTWRRYRLPEELMMRILKRRLCGMPRCTEMMTVALEPSDEATAASEFYIRTIHGERPEEVVVDRRTDEIWPEITVELATDLQLGGRGARAWPWETAAPLTPELRLQRRSRSSRPSTDQAPATEGV